MPFEDQIEQIKEYLQALKERIQESSLYVAAYERYTSLSPQMQKVCIGLSIGFVFFIILSPPIAKFQTSVENLEDFKTRKDIAQSIIQKARQSGSQAQTPKEFNQSEIQNTLNAYNKSPLISIMEEQSSLRQSRNSSDSSVPQAQSKLFVVTNKNVNAEQALTQTYSLKKLNKSLLVDEIRFQESKEKPGYFTHELKLENLYLNPLSEVLPSNGSAGGTNSRGGRNSRRGRRR